MVIWFENLFHQRELGWVLPGGAGKEGQGAGAGGEGGEEEEKRAGSRRKGAGVGGFGGYNPGDGRSR